MSSLEQIRALVTQSNTIAGEIHSHLTVAHALIGSVDTAILNTVQGSVKSDAVALAARFDILETEANNLCQQTLGLPGTIRQLLRNLGIIPPSFEDAQYDNTRITLITGPESIFEPEITKTEQEALHELYDFLGQYINEGSNLELRQEAASLRDSLNFIGSAQDDHAATIIAEDWDEYLTCNPESQILLVPGQTILQGTIKSDAILTENILSRLPNAQQRIDSGRIISSTQDVTAPIEQVRAIIVDDRTLSGEQLSEAIEEFITGSEEGDSWKDKIEAQLVIATEMNLQEGVLASDSYSYTPTTIPVHAAYIAEPRAYPAPPGLEEDTHLSYHTTSFNSSADVGFTMVVQQMAGELAEKRNQPEHAVLPLLARDDLQKPSRESLRLFNRLNKKNIS